MNFLWVHLVDGSKLGPLLILEQLEVPAHPDFCFRVMLL